VEGADRRGEGGGGGWGGGDVALMATDAAEEEGATKLVAVETMVSMKQNLDLAPGETTPSSEEPNHCARDPAPEKKEKARSANPHLHLDHHAPSSRGVLLSAPMADVLPPPPARPRVASCCTCARMFLTGTKGDR
jgi:hypothetical protein